MKSLEIVNQLQNNFNECFSRYDVRTMQFVNPNFFAKEWEQIKADLEVLEIIRNKDVNIKLLESYIKEELENDEYILECYNSHLETYRKLTMEELLKLKQWLEENK